MHHPEQIFVMYVCNGLRDGLDLDYFEPKKCEASRKLTSVNENPYLMRISFQ